MKIKKKSSTKMLPSVSFEPKPLTRASDSKSNTPFYTNLACATWKIFKLLFMHHFLDLKD